jgi:hypothetical protein
MLANAGSGDLTTYAASSLTTGVFFSGSLSSRQTDASLESDFSEGSTPAVGTFDDVWDTVPNSVEVVELQVEATGLLSEYDGGLTCRVSKIHQVGFRTNHIDRCSSHS